jgi:hypothetical protein
MLESEPMQRCRLGECRASCCLHGVWVGVEEAENILAHAAEIAPHLPEGQQDPGVWFDGSEEDDEYLPGGRVRHSTVLDCDWHYGGTACVFLRPDYKCALQVAGQAAGQHPWHFKPFYCVLHPLDLDEQGRITLDCAELLLDEPASCLRPAGHDIPLRETFQPELEYLLDSEDYRRLMDGDKAE